MNEVIEEIKRTEEAAEQRILKAQERAKEISQNADKEEAALRTNYELKLKGSSSLVVAGAKERVNALRAGEAEKNAKLREELISSAQGKMSSCADYVFEFIVGELTK